jgi:hypothetical protein
MLWKWFSDESRNGAEDMRSNMPDGLSAADFEEMLDEHEAALVNQIEVLEHKLAAQPPAAPVGPMPHMCAPCADCGKREPCDGDCPNHLPRCSAGSVADGLLRERIAINLWHKFAPEHHMEWEEETHQAEYLLAADDVLFLTRNEPQGVCMCSPLTRYTDAPHDDTCPLPRPHSARGDE